MNAPIPPFDAAALDLATLDMSDPDWYANDTWHEPFRRKVFQGLTLCFRPARSGCGRF